MKHKQKIMVIPSDDNWNGYHEKNWSWFVRDSDSFATSMDNHYFLGGFDPLVTVC